jgi:hypothetical protein
MEDESNHGTPRKRYFEWVKAWAEAGLAGDQEVHPLPAPFLDPVCHEILVRLSEVEAAVVKAGRCPMAGSAGDGPPVVEALIGPAGSSRTATRTDGLREIRDFTHAVENLVVIDPYAYGGEAGEKAERYVEEFAKATRIGSAALKKLHIIFNSKCGRTKAIIEGIALRASNAGVELTDNDTDLFHDRVWIADRSRGLVVGTSFGGLGNRAAFLLQLPEFDLRHVLGFIDENGLMDGTRRMPKHAPIRRARGQKQR